MDIDKIIRRSKTLGKISAGVAWTGAACIAMLIIIILWIALLVPGPALGDTTRLHTGQDIIEPGVSMIRVIDALGDPIMKRFTGWAENVNYTEVWIYKIKNYYYHIHFSGNYVVLVYDEQQ